MTSSLQNVIRKELHRIMREQQEEVELQQAVKKLRNYLSYYAKGQATAEKILEDMHLDGDITANFYKLINLTGEGWYEDLKEAAEKEREYRDNIRNLLKNIEPPSERTGIE